MNGWTTRWYFWWCVFQMNRVWTAKVCTETQLNCLQHQKLYKGFLSLVFYCGILNGKKRVELCEVNRETRKRFLSQVSSFCSTGWCWWCGGLVFTGEQNQNKLKKGLRIHFIWRLRKSFLTWEVIFFVFFGHFLFYFLESPWSSVVNEYVLRYVSSRTSQTIKNVKTRRGDGDMRWSVFMSQETKERKKKLLRWIVEQTDMQMYKKIEQ